jgi:hypothetical protein
MVLQLQSYQVSFAFSIRSGVLEQPHVINSSADGTGEGWDTDGAVINAAGLGNVLKLSQESGKNFYSNVFTVLPDDIYVFKFGLESPVGLAFGLGLHIGLTLGQPFHCYQYDFFNKKWSLAGSANTNAYFLYDYRTAGRKYYTTYILGSHVDISSAPAPVYTDEAYLIYCLQLTGTDTACRIRSGYNLGHPIDAAWYLIRPQVYRTDGGKVTAENIAARDLSAISALLGRITGSGDPNDDEYKIVLSDGFAGNDNKKGTFKLGGASEESTIRRWWTGSAWKMIIRMSALILENLKSKAIGILQVFGDWQNHDTGNPAFEANPGSGAGSSSVTVRGALRARKSVSDETVVFEALPSGDVNVPGRLYSRSFVKSWKILDLSGLDQNTYYPVITDMPQEKGLFEVVVNVFLNSGTKPSWGIHDRGFACYQHMLALPSGWGTYSPLTIFLGRTVAWTTNDAIPPVGWSQMTNASIAVLWLRGGGKYNVWDSINAAWAVQTAAYTAYNQTVQPQATQVFDIYYSTIHANLAAQNLAVSGSASVQGALTIGANASVVGSLTVSNEARINGGATIIGALVLNNNLRMPLVYDGAILNINETIRGYAAFYYYNNTVYLQYLTGVASGLSITRLAQGIYRINGLTSYGLKAFGWYVCSDKNAASLVVPKQWGVIIGVNASDFIFICKDNNSDDLDEDAKIAAHVFIIG